MVEMQGRLERRKLRTRAALVEAAVRLFTDKGYDRTTVAEIAETADVSTRTFFLHFPTKEDVLFLDAQFRLEVWHQATAERGEDESIGDVVIRAMDDMIMSSWQSAEAAEMAKLRARLIASTPSLHSVVVQRFFAVHTALATELQRSYPDALDLVEASALVGALLGAVSTAALTGIDEGADPEGLRTAMTRAARLAVKHTW